jgi:bifunctional DNA-binding transcriptional regulator/antitoxin component of YhaV-PrlF toxin-antitoxin module
LNTTSKTESEIRQRFQTTIPQEIRDRMELEIGDQLIWKYDERKKEITVIQKPKSFSDALWGLKKKDEVETELQKKTGMEQA